MPLTPVGKIFKPALRWDAAQRVFSEELAALGDMAQSVEVSVGEDKVHGMLASISIKPAAGVEAKDIEEKVSDLLALYTVKYAVEIV